MLPITSSVWLGVVVPIPTKLPDVPLTWEISELPKSPDASVKTGTYPAVGLETLDKDGDAEMAGAAIALVLLLAPDTEAGNASATSASERRNADAGSPPRVSASEALIA